MINICTLKSLMVIIFVCCRFYFYLFSWSEITFGTWCGQWSHKFHTSFAKRCEHMIVSGDFDLETIGMSQRTFDFSPVSTARYSTSHLASTNRRMCCIVVEELSPLHQQHGVVFRRRIYVLRECNAYLPCTWQRWSVSCSRPWRIHTWVWNVILCYYLLFY